MNSLLNTLYKYTSINKLINKLINIKNESTLNKFIKTIILFFIVFMIGILIYVYNKYYFDFDGVYEENIFSPEKFNKIKNLCEKIHDSSMTLDPKASGRMMYTLKPDDPLVKLVNTQDFTQKVRDLTGNPNLAHCPQIPMEYRKYVVGSYMDWHKDTIMLNDQLQYECVITITNTSDSKTLMDKSLYTSSIETQPNSLLIVRAQGVKHKVTKLTQGERTIIKLVFCEPSNNTNNAIYQK